MIESEDIAGRKDDKVSIAVHTAVGMVAIKKSAGQRNGKSSRVTVSVAASGVVSHGDKLKKPGRKDCTPNLASAAVRNGDDLWQRAGHEGGPETFAREISKNTQCHAVRKQVKKGRCRLLRINRHSPDVIKREIVGNSPTISDYVRRKDDGSMNVGGKKAQTAILKVIETWDQMIITKQKLGYIWLLEMQVKQQMKKAWNKWTQRISEALLQNLQMENSESRRATRRSEKLPENVRGSPIRRER